MNTLIVKHEPWNDAASNFLAPAISDYPLDEMQADCEKGIRALFNVYEQQNHIASFVLWKDDTELVVMAAGGYLVGGSLYKIITPYVEEVARQNKCDTLRGHTSRKGVGRLMERAGWAQAEIVYKKKVAHGRQIIQ